MLSKYYPGHTIQIKPDSFIEVIHKELALFQTDHWFGFLYKMFEIHKSACGLTNTRGSFYYLTQLYNLCVPVH